MDCILFRHGLAADREEWDGPDALRPLTSRGIEKTRRAAVGLRRLEIVPDVLLASPYVRAKETASLIQEVLRYAGDVQLCDELTPEVSPDKLVVLLNSLPPEASVICVGHEPHLGKAAGVLLFGRSVQGLALKKAGACLITFQGAPRAGEGTLRWWLTPSQLRALK